MAAPDPLEVTAPLRAEPASGAILCDIDGTLAPIVTDPDAAVVPPPARALLAELAGRYRLVACISGRRASAARRLVGLDQLTYAGNHGLEVLGPGERTPTLDPALGHRGTAAAGFASRLDWDGLRRCGLRLEDKGPIQAIHWRGAHDEQVAAQRAGSIAELAAEQGLVPHFGRLVLELRPVATVDKGVAARRLVGESGATRALFGGDDRTDLDAFAALRELRDAGTLATSVCVGVTSDESPEEIKAEADLVVAGPEGFVEVLRAL
jgi:trehalose 6-phosphate phosphatase